MATHIQYVRVTTTMTEMERVRVSADPAFRRQFEEQIADQLEDDTAELDWALGEGFTIISTIKVDDWRGSSIAYTMYNPNLAHRQWKKRLADHLQERKAASESQHAN